MPTNEATISYQGIRHIVHGSYTLTHGISPSIAQVTCAAQPGPYPYIAPLVFSYSSTHIVLTDARLVDVKFQDRGGLQYLILSIADRRWRWRDFGRIRGEYNVRNTDGTLRNTTRKTPEELARLCLAAMGERRVDVSVLPGDQFPYVNWDGVPAQALAELCEAFGCRVTYDPLSNSVRVVKTGFGRQLPAGFDVTTESFDINPPLIPDTMRLLCGRTLRQAAIELEPIGENPDGTFLPINKLDYIPTDPSRSWKHGLPPTFGAVAKKHRHLAQKTVYKYYRIKTPQKILDEQVDTIERLLPIETTQAAVARINADTKSERASDISEPQSAVIIGDWSDTKNERDAKPPAVMNTSQGVFPVKEDGFSIDPARGFVMFSEPIYSLVDATNKPQESVNSTNLLSPRNHNARQRRLIPARLFLVVATGIRDAKTHAWERLEVPFTPTGPKLGTAPYYLDRDDIQFVKYERPQRDGKFAIVDNRSDVTEQAGFYLRQALYSFALKSPGVREYAGWRSLQLDGALSQITWLLDADGKAKTTISRNSEQVASTLTFDEMREREQIRKMLAREARDNMRRRREQR